MRKPGNGSWAVAILILTMTLAKGEEFDTKVEICAAAVTFNNLIGKSHYSRKSCTKRLVLLCSSCRKFNGEDPQKKLYHDLTACNFVISASLQKSGGWKISQCDLVHSCSVSVRTKFYKTDVVESASGIAKLFQPSGSGDVKQLQSMLKINERLSLKYHQAHALVEERKGHSVKAPFDQFARLPSLLKQLQEEDPSGAYELQWDEDDSAFRYCFICPSAGLELWEHSRKLLCCDGAHVRSLMKGTLLTATVKDADAHSVLLALLYCPSEDEFHWKLFLKELQKRFHGIDMIMSDRDKGGAAAAQKLGIRMSVCLKHIEKNVRSSFSTPEELKKFLWSLGRSATKEESTLLIKKIRKVLPNHQKAIEYILSRKSEFCTEDFIMDGHIRYNELTNNTAEVKNRSLKAARGLPVVEMIKLLLKRESELWSSNHSKSLVYSHDITPAAHRMAETGLETALTWKCQIKTVRDNACEAMVWVENKFSYLVRLDSGNPKTCRCRCGKSTNRGYPCDHGLLVLSDLSATFPSHPLWSPVAKEWYDEVFHTATWRRQYENPFCLADYQESDLEPTILKPWAVVPQGKGRPKSIRFKSGRVLIPKSGAGKTIQKQSKCTLCKEDGHNRRSCTARNLRAIQENLFLQ